MKLDYIIYLAIILSATIAGLINYSGKVKPMLPLILVLGYTFLSQYFAHWAAATYRNNAPVEHLYGFVSVLLYTLFFYKVITYRFIRKALVSAGVIIMIFSIVNVIWFQPINQQPLYNFQLRTLYFFAGGSILLLQQLDLPSDESIFKNPVFLAGLSLVWFNTMSSLFFFMSPLFKQYEISRLFLSQIHYYSNCVHYLLFLVAMVYLKKYTTYERAIHG